MDMPTTLTNSGSSSLILDGRRPTAGVNPLNYGGQFRLTWSEHISQRNRADWDGDRWKEYIKYVQSCPFHRYNTEGGLAALEEMMSDAYIRSDNWSKRTTAREKLQRDLGPREFTLTYSPKWYENDSDAQAAMRVAIDKLTRYYKDEIIDFHAIGEYTKTGHSHIHCYYELDGGRKITDKNFKRAWSHWNARIKLDKGHQGGHHATIKSKSDFLGYIEKDLDTAWMNVHITRNANDNQTTQRDGSTEELSQSSGSYNS